MMSSVTATTFYNRTAELDRIAVPTLLIFGEADTLTTPAMGAEMNRRIKGSKLVVVPKSGHLINLEQPEAFDHWFRPAPSVGALGEIGALRSTYRQTVCE